MSVRRYSHASQWLLRLSTLSCSSPEVLLNCGHVPSRSRVSPEHRARLSTAPLRSSHERIRP